MVDDQLITGLIKKAVDDSVQQFMENVAEQLTNDPAWIDKIEKLVTYQMTSRLVERLSTINLDALITSEVDRSIDKWQDRLKKDFKTTGIVDQSVKVELTVLDEAVVVENQLIASRLLVDKDAAVSGTTVLNNLIVKGTINTDNHAWDEISSRAAVAAVDLLTDQWKQQLTQQVLDLAKTDGIDFGSIKINGNDIVAGDTLSNSIVNSNLQAVGKLRELEVAGHVELNETVTVNRNRVGINTTSPEMALSVWDEEVSIVAGKFSKQHAYIGTNRLNNISIGVNRVPQIELDVDGLTTINKLRVGQHRIGFGTDVPGHSGTRGDLVFNSDPKPNMPFAWVCIGGFKWQLLRST